MTWIYFTFGEFGEKGSPTFGMGPISLLPVKQVGVSAKKNACTKRSGSPLNKSPLLLLSPYTLSRRIVVPVFDSTRRIQYFQTGDDRSVGSCVTMHREATLSKQLWQANGASRTSCFSCSQFFFGGGGSILETTAKCAEAASYEQAASAIRNTAEDKLKTRQLKSHTPTPPCAFSCTCCPPSTLFHLFHYLWLLSSSEKTANIAAARLQAP